MRGTYDGSLKAKLAAYKHADMPSLSAVYKPASWPTDHDAALLSKLGIELRRGALLLQLVYNVSHLFNKLSIHSIHLVRLYLCRLGWHLGQV